MRVAAADRLVLAALRVRRVLHIDDLRRDPSTSTTCRVSAVAEVTQTSLVLSDSSMRVAEQILSYELECSGHRACYPGVVKTMIT